jgi:hypothetical protein
MLGTAIALGSIPIGRVEPQLFRSPVAIALYAVGAVSLLWPLVNRFLAWRPRRPAHEVHRGHAHDLLELAADAAHLPEAERVLTSAERGTGTYDGHDGPRPAGNR